MVYRNLVIGGGGIKGLYFLGALKKLEENKVLDKIQNYAGTSVGAIICVLLLVGYTAQEIFDFMYNLDLGKVEIEFSIDNLLDKFGLDTGNKVEYIIRRLISEKTGNEHITMQELFEETGKGLTIVSTCMSEHKSYYLTHETHPDLPVVQALRMSISIPIAFEPIKYDNKYFIDGGVLDNYPFECFKNPKSTLGICVVDPDFYTGSTAAEVDDVWQFAYSMLQCVILGNFQEKIRKYLENSIAIQTLGLGIAEFVVEPEVRNEMFDVGYQVAGKFLAEKKEKRKRKPKQSGTKHTETNHSETKPDMTKSATSEAAPNVNVVLETTNPQ